MLKPRFKCHCSSIGAIMTNPQKKSDKISKTAQSVAEDWMNQALYDRKQSFSSKYTEKGNECEEDSIKFASEVYGWGDVSKNTETRQNEWFIGTCDVNRGVIGTDIKNSWSEKTFPLYNTEIPDKNYIWQGHGYGDLYGFEKFEVIYTLMDAPEWLIEQEASKQQRILRLDDLELELYQEVERKMTYSNLPNFLRIKKFDFDISLDMINEARCRVDVINEWIENETDFYELLNRKHGNI